MLSRLLHLFIRNAKCFVKCFGMLRMNSDLSENVGKNILGITFVHTF